MLPASTYYIIEHPRRGTFREMDSDWRAGKSIDIPRFSSTGARNDPNKAMRFRTLEEAITMVRRIIADDDRMKRTLTLRRSPDFHKYCPECKHWIDEFMQAQNGHAAKCSRRDGANFEATNPPAKEQRTFVTSTPILVQADDISEAQSKFDTFVAAINEGELDHDGLGRFDDVVIMEDNSSFEEIEN